MNRFITPAIVSAAAIASRRVEILSQTSITLHTGASIKGRLLAQTAVNLDGSTAVEPAP